MKRPNFRHWGILTGLPERQAKREIVETGQVRQGIAKIFSVTNYSPSMMSLLQRVLKEVQKQGHCLQRLTRLCC